MIALSKRLQAVVNLAKPGNTAADIGCDHGYVGIWLVQKGIFSNVIAMDVRPGPLEAAKKNIAFHHVEDVIEIRQSDGLQGLDVGEADCMICAGMGGALTCRILSEGMEKARAMKQIILQPQSEIPMVRQFLRQNRFDVIREDMVEEDGKFYPMFCAKPLKETQETGTENKAGEKLEPVTLADEFGGLLLESRHPVLRDWLLYERQLNGAICPKLEQAIAAEQDIAARERQKKRLGEIRDKLYRIEEALKYYG